MSVYLKLILDKYVSLRKKQINACITEAKPWLIGYHIIPKLGQIPLAKLVPHHLVTMYEKLRIEAGLSPQSINHVYKVLNDGLATAVRHEILNRNVAALVKPPKIPKTKTTVWTSEQLGQFLQYTEPYRYHMIILLAATCGLRRGEAIALRWEDVDLKARTLTVKQSYTGRKGAYISGTKDCVRHSNHGYTLCNYDCLEKAKSITGRGQACFWT